MKIEGSRTVPYFPYKVRRRGKGWETVEPVESCEYELNADAVRILQLCNGYYTLDEIAYLLSLEFGTGFSRIEEIVHALVGDLSSRGLIWLRRQRMQWSLPPPPRFVLWNITSECNLRCLHCVNSAGGKSGGELTTGECKMLLDDLSAFGVRGVIFSGGEPLLRDDFFELVRHARENGFSPSLATNGTLIDRDTARRLKHYDLNLLVSLDGSTPGINDRFRGRRGSYEKTVRGVKLLLEAGVPVLIESAVTRLNIDDIPRILDLAIALGVNSYRILPFVPGGRGRDYHDLEVAPDEMRQITAYLMKRREEGKIEIVPMEFEWTFSEPPVGNLDPATRIGCDAATGFCSVTADGEVLPCDYFMGIEADNVKDHEFSRIWHHSRFLNYFRSLKVSDIEGACRECRWLPRCRGSCIAPNYVHGSLFESNCHCWIAGEMRRSGRSVLYHPVSD